MSAGRPIRATIVSPGPQSEGGIRSVVERIYPRLAIRDDIHVTWLASQRAGSALGKFLFFLKALVKAFFYLPSSDVVHIHGAVHLSLLRKSAFIWLARLFRCRVIYHFHAPQTVFEDFFSLPGIRRSYALATLRQCDAIVVLSDSWETTVRKVLPDSTIVVIYNPVMEAQPVAKTRHAENQDVLYLAHLIRRKGYDDLVKAFAIVVDKVPGARLVFCGSGETDEAQRLGEKLGIAANIVFRGWIAETDIAQALSSAAVFCLPSYDEGLPMGILEAMSSGVAIVTTPVGGVPDVLTHERNALLVEPGDIDDLGEQLARLLIDADLRRRLADEALRDSVAFRPEKITEDWARLYHNVVATEGRASR
jgi:glycosyltransferase involved in cell wall biosynthesis